MWHKVIEDQADATCHFLFGHFLEAVGPRGVQDTRKMFKKESLANQVRQNQDTNS